MYRMGGEPKPEVPNTTQPLSVPLQMWGWLALAGALPFVFRLVYEQTVLTWDDGLQALGWTLNHTYGGLFVLGVLASIFLNIWLVAFLVVWVCRRLRRKTFFSFGAWLQFGLLSCSAILFYIPYDVWQFATLEIAGPGHNVAGQLTAAVAENHGYLVKAFIRSGVPTDTLDSNHRTALDKACLVGNVELARYLISHKAQLDLAPNCRKVADFARKMKPLVPAVEEQSGRPHLAGTTVDVTAPAPQADYNRVKAKP